jgi:hypothetical protein
METSIRTTTLLFWELNFQLTPDGGRLQRHVRAQYSPTYPVNVKRRSCRRSSHVRGHRDDQVIPLAVVGRACAPHHGLDRVVGVAGKRERLAPVVRCKPQNILILFSPRRGLTGIVALRVLHPAEVPLVPDADAVVLIRELQSRGGVVIERPDLARHSGEVLQTTLFGWKQEHHYCWARVGLGVYRDKSSCRGFARSGFSSCGGSWGHWSRRRG